MGLKRVVAVASLVMLGMLTGGAAPLFAQSLGDLAKKEEERRKAIPEAAKVYTNKDLNAVPPSSIPPSGTPATPAPAQDEAKGKEKEVAKDPAKDDKDTPKKDQAYWAGRIKTLKDELDRNQTYADAMQSRVNSLSADFVNRDDPAQRAIIERDRQKATGELNRLVQAVKDGKKAIADLEEEARRAGVPPGWLR